MVEVTKVGATVVAAACILPNVDDRHPSVRKHGRIDVGYHQCSDR